MKRGRFHRTGAFRPSRSTEQAPQASSLLVSYTDALGVPPAFQASLSLEQAGFRHSTIHRPVAADVPSAVSAHLDVRAVASVKLPTVIRPIQQIWNWRRFRAEVAAEIERVRPALIVAMMLHSLAALPFIKGRGFRLAACIYDIPSLRDSGKYDRQLLRQGWRRLQEADVVWASDPLKAELAHEHGGLRNKPLVCYNCPSVSYLPDPARERNGWLREALRKEGAPLASEGGSILLRAGAVGPFGGIEDTFTAMADLPDDFVFLLLGRPAPAYRQRLDQSITELKLNRRVFVWERVADAIWKRALQGADIGHLIHQRPPAGPLSRLFDLNSSLSNNRLFQYMAAGLPVISYDDPRLSPLHTHVDMFEIASSNNIAAGIRQSWADMGSNTGLRRSRGDAGRAAHLETYNWETQFAPVLAALTS